MSFDIRPPDNKTPPPDPGDGIQLATVIGHLDPTFGGGLQVTLIKNVGNLYGEAPYEVKPAFPFFGNTHTAFTGKNNKDFDDTQKSYGMWFVPPDVGTNVLVVFLGGDVGKGYWFACVPGSFVNHMVPALAGSEAVDITTDDRKKYATTGPLPVGEINRLANAKADDGPNRVTNPDKMPKPVHPIADAFLTQGLLQDYVRGVTTTTSRRTPPNSVYGISTPGPLDRREGAPTRNLGTTQYRTPGKPQPVSRLGGTTFVMDDGDDRYQRKASASQLGEGNAYADTENGERGDPTIPQNEYFRVRTRTGHQLLMHNSEDLIYIGNARGTAWIELSSDGKIDIYANDSISVHTQNDLNFYADRDINMEAGRNVNIKASAQYSKTDPTDEKGKIKDAKGYESGRVQIESAYNTNILIGANGKIETRIYKNESETDTDGNLDVNIKGHTKVSTGQGNEAHNLEFYTFGKTLISSFDTLDINSGGNMTVTAPRIDLNGPVAAVANLSDTITDLTTHANLVTNGELTWNETKYIEDYNIDSIVKRMPMHEPWPFHENITPLLFKKDKTDREA